MQISAKNCVSTKIMLYYMHAFETKGAILHMKSKQELQRQLSSIDHRGYPAYKSLAGQYDFGSYTLSIDHVQGDPFASPSKLRMIVKHQAAAFPAELYSQTYTRTALQDHLNRLFFANIRKFQLPISGTGGSGRIDINRCGQQVLERSGIQFLPHTLEARFTVGFPAAGRTILAGELQKLLFDVLPQIAQHTLFYRNIDQKAAVRAVELAHDQHAIRQALPKLGLAAFVSNGAVLPRESGISDRPLRGGVPFQSPPSLEVAIETPHSGTVRGMGIRKGITLIVGGGYHGKSTLLRALEEGVYNHIRGDGREFVITDADAVKIRAEDGRSIVGDDISAFISNLPNGKDTRSFSTENASGSTSQAANVAEAIEAGASVLLIDEDTSATNFMIRDAVMQQLIRPDMEPITPFIDRVSALYRQLGLSTILVVGSSGSYFSVADCVIQMDQYQPHDCTAQARALGKALPAPALDGENICIQFDRVVSPASFAHSDRGPKIKAHGRDTLSFNKEDIDLRYVEQITDAEQVAALGYLLSYAQAHIVDGRKTIRQIADAVMQQVDTHGLLSILPGSYCPDFLALPRRQEFLACLNRFRRLRLQ